MHLNFSSFNSSTTHRIMLADSQRLDSYRQLISHHCPKRKVVDFGAGSGVLGILAFLAGASDVWFVEKEKRMIDYIKKNALLNGLVNPTIVESIEDLPTDFFDVCLSETLGDLGIDESVNEYNKLLISNPNCIAIPDTLTFKYEPLNSPHLNKLNSNINACGIKLVSELIDFTVPIKFATYGVLKDRSKDLYKIDLFEPLPSHHSLTIKAPVLPDYNSMLLWWCATSQEEYVTSNSPHLNDTKFNHWKQVLIPPNRDHRLLFDFNKRSIFFKYSNTDKYLDLSKNN